MAMTTKPTKQDLPIVTLLTVIQHKNEWQCVAVRMQGDEVLEREVIGGGPSHQHAWGCFQIAALNHFYRNAWT